LADEPERQQYRQNISHGNTTDTGSSLVQIGRLKNKGHFYEGADSYGRLNITLAGKIALVNPLPPSDAVREQKNLV